MKPNEENSVDILNQQVANALNKISEKYNNHKLEQMLKALSGGNLEELGWTLPPRPLHITTTLLNGKATMKNKKSIDESKTRVEEKISIRCIIVVEDLFVATLCTPKLAEVNSKIPYMALWMNGAKPKDCTKILEYLLYQVKPSMKYAEEKLRTYYAILNKATLKDDVVGEIKINFDKYKTRKVWYCFIKDAEKLGFETFIKNLGGEE